MTFRQGSIVIGDCRFQEKTQHDRAAFSFASSDNVPYLRNSSTSNFTRMFKTSNSAKIIAKIISLVIFVIVVSKEA